MIRKLLGTGAWLALAATGLCGNVMDRHFSPEEQALWDRHLYMFTHLPDQPSGHQIVKITTAKGSGECLDVNFGAEDYAAARAAGIECAARGLGPVAAGSEILSKAKERYPGLPYFINTFVDAAMRAYNTTPSRNP
jgi:hypothetical protein